MQFDCERAEEKRRELITLLDAAISDVSGHQLATRRSDITTQSFGAFIFDHFVQISPPEKEPISLDLVILRPGGSRGGHSYKLGNIFLDIRKLFAALASGVLTVTGAVVQPWTVPFAAIILWNALWSGFDHEISEQDAAVLWTMWQVVDESNCVPKKGLLRHVNEQLERYGRPEISSEVLNNSLSLLNELGCIEDINGHEKFWLRENIKVEYQ